MDIETPKEYREWDELAPLSPKEQKKIAKAGKQAWNECFGDQIEAKKNWQRIAFASMGVTALAVGGMIHLGGLPKSDVWLVEKDQNRHIVYAGRPHEQSLTAEVWDQIYVDSLQTLVWNWRLVTSDKAAQDDAWDRVFSTYIGAGSQADAYLRNWYAENDPNRRAAKGELVRVEFETTDRVGDTSYGLWWKETTTSLSGEVKSVKHWHCVFTLVKKGGIRFLVTELRPEEVHAHA